MGCWNGTCGISGIGINHGTDVKVVIIKNKSYFPNATMFIGLEGYASPLSFVIEAKYNDYGSIENIEDNYALKLFMKWYRNNLKLEKIFFKFDGREDFETDNMADIEPEELFKLMERGKVFLKDKVFKYTDDFQDYVDVEVNIGMFMIHSDVYDSIVNVSKNTSTDCGTAVEDLFEKNVEKKREVDKLIEEARKSDDKDKVIKIYSENYDILRDDGWKSKIRAVGKWYNIVYTLAGKEGSDAKVFQDYYDYIGDDYTKDNHNEVKTTLEEYITLTMAMDSLQTPFRSVSSGSQTIDDEAFFNLAKGIRKAVISQQEDVDGYECYNIKDYTINDVTYPADSKFIVSVNDNTFTLSRDGNEVGDISYYELMAKFEY